MESQNELGKIIKQQRLVQGLTLRELAATSGVSASHLGRLEKGERSPSARTLQKIAKPLGFGEGELLSLAGYMSPQSSPEAERPRRLDPYVARVLSEEPVELQRTVIGILSILKGIARGLK